MDPQTDVIDRDVPRPHAHVISSVLLTTSPARSTRTMALRRPATDVECQVRTVQGFFALHADETARTKTMLLLRVDP